MSSTKDIPTDAAMLLQRGIHGKEKERYRDEYIQAIRQRAMYERRVANAAPAIPQKGMKNRLSRTLRAAAPIHMTPVAVVFLKR